MFQFFLKNNDQGNQKNGKKFLEQKYGHREPKLPNDEIKSRDNEYAGDDGSRFGLFEPQHHRINDEGEDKNIQDCRPLNG